MKNLLLNPSYFHQQKIKNVFSLFIFFVHFVRGKFTNIWQIRKESVDSAVVRLEFYSRRLSSGLCNVYDKQTKMLSFENYGLEKIFKIFFLKNVFSKTVNFSIKIQLSSYKTSFKFHSFEHFL